jgi:hypothetical protein
MTMKLKIRVGNVEVEYEGPEAFVNKKLPELIANVAKIKGTGRVRRDGSDEERDTKDKPGEMTGTTNTIAAKLGCETGPDLILAAATRLALVLGKSSFMRKELLAEMKQASTYYKKSYKGNLTQNLSSLVKANSLNETAKDTYSLAAGTRADLKKKLS